MRSLRRTAGTTRSVGPGLVAFGVALGALLLVSILWLPGYLVGHDLGSRPESKLTSPDLLKAKNDVRGTLIQAIGGGLFLATAFFTWRQLRVSEQEQVSSRFTKAIEQIGGDKPDVRLGGIYALERIGRDAPREHELINDVLTAFLRGGSAWDPQSASREDELEIDVQAALTVIARRDAALDAGRLDLSHLDLRRAHLEHAHLDGALLNGTSLDGARLRGAGLADARLVEARLEGADLADAKLRAARLVDASLARAGLIGADLTDALLVGADLSGTRLMKAKLEGANLKGATIDGKTRLRGASWDAETRWPDGFDPDAHAARDA